MENENNINDSNKGNNNNNDYKFDLEIYNKFFNKNIFEKFCEFLKINKLMNMFNIDKSLEKNLRENLMSFNFIGIKE